MTSPTPNPGMDRRRVLQLAGLSSVSLCLAACGKGFGGSADGGDGKGTVTITMAWWGDATRAAKTQAALDVFHRKNPDITVKTEYQDSAPYKDKLATRFAAGNPPDLMAMRVDSLREYADRGGLVDLNKHTDVVDTSKLNPNVLALATVGEANYGVASGLNSIGFIVNKTMTDKYGVAVPDGNTWNWDDLGAFAKELSAKSKRAVYGTGFEVYTLANLIVFTRQRGEDFYTQDGKLGVSQDTVTAWFDLVEKMRAEGGFPPAGFFENLGASADQSYIAKGTLASQIIPTNNFLVYQKACGGNLALLRMPGESTAKRRGQSVDTPMLWSVAARSKHVTESLKLLGFLLNDVDGAKAVGTTRGVPANPDVAQAIKDSLPPDDQTATTYLAGLQQLQLPPTYPYPKGSSSLSGTLQKIATEVEFNRQSSVDGAKAFLAAAQKALGA